MTNNLEANVDVEEHSALLHDETGVKARPHLDLVRSEVDALGGVEALPADGLEPQASHH